MNKTCTKVTLAFAVALSAASASAVDISFRVFSNSAAIGPPAVAFASKLTSVSETALGYDNQVRFVRLAGIPAIPSQFGGSIMAAVAAGGPLAYSLGAPGGGFDAAYNS
ncbi:MAG TPA: hypothetical protein VLS93_03860, partial [Anaeromyxobacteraceae bacterium]|nr:hypothetical protein [Anaeromyxobacteraceae bacterium]